MNTVIQDYKNGTLFYTLATVLPWSLWGIAAYISHAPGISRASELASVLAFVGLLAPALVALMMIYSDERLSKPYPAGAILP